MTKLSCDSDKPCGVTEKIQKKPKKKKHWCKRSQMFPTERFCRISIFFIVFHSLCLCVCGRTLFPPSLLSAGFFFPTSSISLRTLRSVITSRLKLHTRGFIHTLPMLYSRVKSQRALFIITHSPFMRSLRVLSICMGSVQVLWASFRRPGTCS